VREELAREGRVVYIRIDTVSVSMIPALEAVTHHVIDASARRRDGVG
jgi:hypothetical protein